MALLDIPAANGFAPDTYAEHSVLKTGHWIRVSVTSDGPVLIPTATLRQWGFANPERVRVFGYGGKRISDVLTIGNYVDDLPQLQTIVEPKGVIFYAEGPEDCVTRADGMVLGRVNPFSQHSYYYITEDDGRFAVRPIAADSVRTDASALTVVSSFRQALRHEVDKVNYEQSGHNLYGEDFKMTPRRTFGFDMPGRDETKPVQLNVSFVGASYGDSRLIFNVNGTQLDDAVTVPRKTGYVAANEVTFSRSLDNVAGIKLNLQLSYEPSGTVTAANLNSIDINYTRRLTLDNGSTPLVFEHSDGSPARFVLTSADKSVSVYDVTDPHNIKEVSGLMQDSDGTYSWTASKGRHRYAVWGLSTLLPAPVYDGNVANSDLHDISRPVPDMVIVTRHEWLDAAGQLAELHRTDSDNPLTVDVVDARSIYNEFSSGTTDVGALRRYFKMLYDRGVAAGTPLRMALLMGRATFDNRGLTDEMTALREMWLPTWNTDESLRENDSYTSDDILAFLEDGSGQRMPSDRYCIAVGRLPVGTVNAASAAVAKIRTHMANRDLTGWKNRVLLVADDGNLGVHMTQTETMQQSMLSASGGNRMFYHKAYVDAFPLVGGSAQGARERMHRLLDEGVMLWSYVGHAGRNFLTGDNILTYTDINAMRTKRWPVFYGATCSFARWDGVDPSGCELMFANPRGGIIAAVSATREVLISENGLLSDSWGKEVFSLDSLGRYPTIGEAYMRAKNRLASPYNRVNANKLKYVLLGDPALRPWPGRDVEIKAIADAIPGDEDNPPVLMARQTLTVEGCVTDGNGKELTDFDGVVTAAIHDAEFSTTSIGRPTTNDGNGERVTFEEQGDKLYAGNDSIRNGRFSLRVAMPSEVADNYRPAALTLYAASTDGREAIGCERRFYVFGFDENAPEDNRPPVIEYLYLNHDNFADGQAVNPSPLLMARVTDDTGINLSSAGIGHRMTVRLDSIRTYADAARYFTPLADGTPGGTLAYPLSDLETGEHTLEFRVWDTGGNSAARTIAFEVRPGLAPTLFDVYTDANPAIDHADFYVRHDRPDADLTVTVQVCDLMGRTVWTGSASDRSDMFVSAPLHWDLRDHSGRRVPRGIYLYRTTVTVDGSRPQTLTRRLAVAAR